MKTQTTTVTQFLTTTVTIVVFSIPFFLIPFSTFGNVMKYRVAFLIYYNTIIGRHKVLLPINHKNYNFREKNSQIMKERGNLH